MLLPLSRKPRTPRELHFAGSGRLVPGVRERWNDVHSCSCIVGHGVRAGQECGRETEPGDEYCGYHSGKRSCEFPSMDTFLLKHFTVGQNLERRKQLAPMLHTHKKNYNPDKVVAAKVPKVKAPKAPKERKTRECQRSCRGVKADGSPCGMCPSVGKNYCYHHGK